MRQVLVVLVRWLGEALIRLYYPRREVVQLGETPRAEPPAQIPAGPVIFVANHPNGLLDPLLVRVATERPARFLAKSTLFANPFGRLAMDAFGSFPVARVQDVRAAKPAATDAAKPDEAKQAKRAKLNEETFARCHEVLARGEAIALFPEGTSHSDPQMRPFKTGAARIALGAEAAGAAAGRPLGLQIVPVGLAYDRKTTFRSGALAVLGEPIAVGPRMPAFATDGRAAVETLTEDIRRALDAVVLQADSHELLAGVSALARWSTPTPGADGKAERHRRAQALLRVLEGDAQKEREAEAGGEGERGAGEKERQGDKARGLAPLLSRVRLYAGTLRQLGVRNPWALELELVTLPAALRATLRLVLALPLAAAGALLGWVPYRLAGIVAPRITKEADVLSTVKLIAGMVFLLLAWTAEIVVAVLAVRGAWALPVALGVAGLAIGGGYLALCVEEWAREAWLALRYTVIRRQHRPAVARLVARRQELVDQVTAALEQAEPPRTAPA